MTKDGFPYPRLLNLKGYFFKFYMVFICVALCEMGILFHSILHVKYYAILLNISTSFVSRVEGKFILFMHVIFCITG